MTTDLLIANSGSGSSTRRDDSAAAAPLRCRASFRVAAGRRLAMAQLARVRRDALDAPVASSGKRTAVMGSESDTAPGRNS